MGINNDLKDVYTFAEAAAIYGLKDASTLRKAVQNNRFTENEIKKVGTTWIVTKAAMDRLYGVRKHGIAGRAAVAKNKAAEQEGKLKNKDKGIER